MDIEVVEFYIDKEDKSKHQIVGSLHIYFTNFDMDLRGIFVKKTKNRWFFALPFKWSLDPSTQKKMKYPVFNFTQPEKNADLMKEIRKKAVPYIAAKLRELRDKDGQ